MLRVIDSLLNRVTMYRLALYYLILLAGAAVFLCFSGGLAYDPYGLLLSISFLLAVCAFTNWIFARTFGVPANVESTYITALILALIITPLQSYNDLWFLGWAAVLAMASKYILVIRGKHAFNPAAIAVALTYFTINQSASWWVANASLLPLVVVGGLLLVRKIRRFEMVISYLLAGVVTVLLAALVNGSDPLVALQRSILYSPVLFFAFVMITEPLTTPPTRKLRTIYAVLVGILCSPLVHFGTFYTTPELALVFGNIFSFLASPKGNLTLRLKSKVRLAPDVYEFVFIPPRKLAFAPGQYMEWTLGHTDPDSRGNRRYFTLASAPTEPELRLGVKYYGRSSSFKKALAALNGGQEIVAAQLAGDFTLPKDPRQKCVLIAGGIGITPYRSMIKYLLDTQQRRSMIVFYANKTADEIVYKDILDRAERELGIRTNYALSDTSRLPAHWRGLTGRFSANWISSYVPGYQQYIFYISGPDGMVDSVRTILGQLGIPDSQIKVDYFSGLA